MIVTTRSQRIGSTASARLSLLALALITSQITLAADDGWYGGFNIGRSRANVDGTEIVTRLLNDGFNSATLTEYEKDTAYKLYGGYQLNPNMAVEGGYFNLGEFGYMAEMDPVATMRGDTRMLGFNLDLVGMAPLTDKFSAFGKVGVIYAQAKDQFSGHGPVIIDPFNTRKRGINYTFGAGLQYDISKALAMRVEAERFRINDAIGSTGDIDLFSIGVVYRFGRQKPVAAAPTPKPAPVTAAPAPKPAPVAAAPAPKPAPPPAPMRVNLSADSLFDFNSSTIKPAGRAELDKLAADLRGVTFDTIQVTGYTDRIGAQAYNQRLSNQRANAVKDYLVRSANISASQVNARGVDGSSPITTLAQCPTRLSRDQLIICLAPDRRVEVEVTGTKPR
jgi:OOP family OmpA-OmpF porin